MKIAVVVEEFPALSETFVLNQITDLIDRGHDVTIIANKKRNEKKIHSNYKDYDLINKTIYYETPPHKLKRFKILLDTDIPKAKMLKSFLYNKTALNLKHAYLYKNLKDIENFDVIYCHFGTNGLIIALLKQLGLIKSKLVTVFHGNDVSQYLNKQGNDIYNILFKNGDIFLTVNSYFKDKLISLRCPVSKIHVHHMGVKTIHTEGETKSINNFPAILSIGRLVEKKGFQYAIKAAKILKDKGVSFRYTIVGDGPLYDSLENMIIRYDLQKHVLLVGPKTSSEVEELLENSNIFIAPSVTASNGDQEGIPMVIMEAINYHIPVISTFHSGIPELISHMNTGYLCEEKNPTAIANNIEYIINNYNYSLEMTDFAKQKLETEFNLDKQNKKLIKILEEVKES
ncbi:glycosyltransferase [Priestia flexa]|uniref:glycosyltransferase n=1 Tax=Priestia flexa TaxID=86664 RepID=UPI003F8599D5